MKTSYIASNIWVEKTWLCITVSSTDMSWEEQQAGGIKRQPIQNSIFHSNILFVLFIAITQTSVMNFMTFSRIQILKPGCNNQHRSTWNTGGDWTGIFHLGKENVRFQLWLHILATSEQSRTPRAPLTKILLFTSSQTSLRLIKFIPAVS